MATTPPPAGSTAAETPAGTGNAAVDTFCKDANELAAKLKAVIADPASGDVASVTVSATKLSTDSAALIASQPADSAKISACAKALADAVTPQG